MLESRENQVRTRIAPSPTGYPHIGTIYQALFNYAFAKKHSGKFIVRIEDTDRARLVEGAEDIIFQALDWFNLPEDESPRKSRPFGPYRQSERLKIYQKYAQKLIDSSYAFFSYLPKSEAGVKKDYSAEQNSAREQVQYSQKADQVLPKTVQEMFARQDKNWVVRMKVPKDKNIVIHDEVRGDVSFSPEQVSEQILLKSDGFPTYHLAVVVDDHLMEINYVVRAEEWIPSTPKHVLLYQYFGWELPKFYHTPALRNPDKSKLSKRHGHTNVNWYREEGYLPEAILNYLALLGWSHPEGKEIFSLDEFIQLFDLKDIRPAAPVFDLQKLTWMNGEYIRMMATEDLKKRLIAFDPSLEKKFSGEMFTKLVEIAKERLATLKDFIELTNHFVEFIPAVKTDEEKQISKDLAEQFTRVSDWRKENIFAAMKEIMTKYKVRMPMFYKLLTDSEHGLPLPESLELIGKEQTLTRLQH